MSSIKFYRTSHEFGFLSNFYHSPFTIDNINYPTVEHYFQSSKFLDPQIQRYIIERASPGAAAREGRRRDFPLRSDWEAIKETKMLEGLFAKFSQNLALKEALIGTYPNTLIEESPIDWYWGVGKDCTGLNRLGVLLMHLRGIFMKDDVLMPR